MKKRTFIAFSTAALLLASASLNGVQAHGVWVGERLDQKQLILGEGPGDNAYNPQCVTAVHGYSADWKNRTVQLLDGKNHVKLAPTSDTAVISVAFDYGYWTKGADGKVVNLPMNQVAGATKGTHALKYNVTYLHNVTEVKAVPDIPLQIIPQTDPCKLHRGDELTLQVMKDGKPLANAELIPDVVNNLTQVVKTDANGKATIRVANDGVNVIGVEIAFPVERPDGLATQNKYFTSLTFTLYPEE